MLNIIRGISTAYNGLKTVLIDVNATFKPSLTAKRGGIYGLFSKPLPKTVTAVVKNGRNMVVLFEENPQLKIDLLDGEVALFDGINKIKLSRRNGIEITSAGKVSIGGKGVKISLGAEGARSLVTESFMEFFNAHTHTAAGGATTPPVVIVPADAVCTSLTEAV
jgi:hypothetical protein